MKIRVVCKHDHPDPDCWPNSWWLNGDTASLDKLGRRNGMGSPWLVARCALSVDCPALAYVRARDIEAAIGKVDGVA